MEKINSVFQRMISNRLFFISMLFFAAFLFRSPAMVIDYYDVDELAAIVQVKEYIAGDKPGADFNESKKPLYHAVFKAAYSISPEKGWVVANFISVILVFLTAYFIFLAGSRLYSREGGIAAAFLYAILISSFNRHFMSLNGEVVFNLPIAAGLFFYIMFISNKNRFRWLWLAGALLAGYGAFQVKFQGVIFLLVLPVHLFLYLPYVEGRFTKKHFRALTVFAVLGLALFAADFFITKLIAPSLITDIGKKAFYASGQGFNPAIYFGKLFHRNGLLFIWHFVLWAPAGIYLYRLARRRFITDTPAESALVMLAAASYALIYVGGSRFYFHYFMAVYPPLCLMAAGMLFHPDREAGAAIRNRAPLLLAVPALFFLVWNYKDAAIKHFFPGAFYHEGRVLYWTRAVLVGTFNDYLLPDSSYLNAVNRIKEMTSPGDRIFVWGDGPYLYYFSDRRMGSDHLWPKNRIRRIVNNYKKATKKGEEAARRGEKRLINILEKKKPVLIADTSENGLSTFNFTVTPLMAEYIREKYSFVEKTDSISLYLRKDYSR